MKSLYLLLILLLCSCNMTREWHYSFNDYKEYGAPVTDEYSLRIQHRSVFFENIQRTQKHGYSLRNHTFFTQWTFPF